MKRKEGYVEEGAIPRREEKMHRFHIHYRVTDRDGRQVSLGKECMFARPSDVLDLIVDMFKQKISASGKLFRVLAVEEDGEREKNAVEPADINEKIGGLSEE